MSKWLIFTIFLFSHLTSFATSYIMKCISGSSVNWSDPASWEPFGVPGTGDDVIINCSASTNIITNGDITVKSLKVGKIGYIFGPGIMTVTERIETKYPFFWQMQLHIGPNATGLMTDELPGQDTQGIIFYDDLVVNGTLIIESRECSGKNVTINGKLTQKEGGIKANVLVNANGILNIESPIYQVDLHTVTNKGTINWKNGKITAGWGPFSNDGVLNIEPENAKFEYRGFFNDFAFRNTGIINVSASVDSLSILSEVVSSGSINMSGPTKLNLIGLDLSGSIIGPEGSTLHVNGLNSNLETFFRNGAEVNVFSFITTQYPVVNILQGSDISGIKNFNFGRGPLTANVVLPPASNYVISADIQTVVDQNFIDKFTLEGGSFSGDATISFNTPNLVMNSGYFGGNTSVKLSPETISDVTQLGVSDLVNDGIMNIRSGGYLSTSLPGFFNNGTITTNGEMVFLFGYNNNTNTGLLYNNGVINFNSKMATVSAKLENNGTINIGINDTVSISGELLQKALISGQSGSKLSLGYSTSGHTFNAGSVTKNLDELEVFYGTANLKSGAILENLIALNSVSGTLQSSIILPPDIKYYFKDSKIRLNTQFEPAKLWEIEDSDIEGSGNIRINNSFNWFGGTLDVPVRINDNAMVSIWENLKRPIISAPFTNLGSVTLSGGIIEINTGFFKNAGIWNIDSEEDVIIDGYTSFTNQGTFSICGEQPIKIIFNVPFLNEGTGTFKGQGSYTFNAGFENEGAVAPGCSPGRLVIEDNVETINNLEIEVEGQEDGEFDELIVNGDMVAGDILNVIMSDGTFVNGSVKIIHTTGKFTGQFDEVKMPGNFTLEYLPDGVLLSSTGTVAVSEQNIRDYGITVHPTLVNTFIELTFEQVIPTETQIQLYNMQGELVSTSTDQKDLFTARMDVGHLPDGLYVVKLNTLPSWHSKIAIVH